MRPFLYIRYNEFSLDLYSSQKLTIGLMDNIMDFQAFYQEWLTSFLEYLPKLIAGIVIFIGTLIGAGFVAKWVKKVVMKKIDSVEMLELIFLITRWSVVIFGTILALDQVDFDVTGFVAGLGIVGFTIGFALQDLAKNFISGLLLLYRQPFNLGERVKISDYIGQVKEINVRDTVIETLEGELVIIPNKEVFENPIVNLTHTRFRRREVLIGLGYEEDADQAMEIFLDTVKSIPGVESDPGPAVRAEELGDSALILKALFWVDQQTNNFLEVHSNVVKAIKVAAEENNINLPYPVQTVLVRNLED